MFIHLGNDASHIKLLETEACNFREPSCGRDSDWQAAYDSWLVAGSAGVSSSFTSAAATSASPSSDGATPTALTRITFFGHGVAKRNGDKRYGSSAPDQRGPAFPGFTPEEFLMLLKRKLPASVTELDLLGCDIGLGYSSGAAGDKSWVDELACRIRLDHQLGGQIKIIRSPHIPDAPPEYRRFMVKMPVAGQGYQGYLLNGGEALRLKEINSEIKRNRLAITALQANVEQLEELTSGIVGKYAEQAREKSMPEGDDTEITGEIEADEKRIAELTALTHNFADSMARLEVTAGQLESDKSHLLAGAAVRDDARNGLNFPNSRAYCESFPSVHIERIDVTLASTLIAAIGTLPPPAADGAAEPDSEILSDAFFSEEFFGHFDPDDFIRKTESEKAIEFGEQEENDPKLSQ